MRSAGSRDIPPPLELLCLKALWSLQEASVTEVRRFVAETKALAYTTVMTVLERLVRRGAVSRRKVGRAFVYLPQASRDSVRRLALAEFLETFFDGSEEQLLAFLQSGAPPERLPSTREAGLEARLDTALL